MNLVRKYKISKLGIPLTNTEQEIVNFIDSWISDLIIFKPDNENYTFYMNRNNKFVLQINGFDNMFVRGNGFGDVLQNKYKISLDDIKKILNFFISKKLNIKIRQVYLGVAAQIERIEKEWMNELSKEV